MKIRNWEMLRNEWTLEGLACNAGKTAISMRSLMSGIFSCNAYQFQDTTLWEHVRNVSIDFRSKGIHEETVTIWVIWAWFASSNSSNYFDCTHRAVSELLLQVTPQRLSLWSLAMFFGPDVGEQSEYLKKIIPARGPRKDLCVVVVTTSQLSGKSHGDGYSNDVIQNLSIRLFERTWVLTSGHQTTDVCDVSHQNGTHLDRNWSNMLSLWANHQSGQQSHPTSSAICRNLAKSMTRGYAEAPHKIMAGRKTKAVFPQNDEPIRIVFGKKYSSWKQTWKHRKK